MTSRPSIAFAKFAAPKKGSAFVLSIEGEGLGDAASAFDPDAWYQTNGEFHAAIHGAAHNKMLAEQIEHLNKRLSPYRRFITFRPGRTDTAMREHEAVFEALLARDGLTASMALRDHVRVLAEDSLALSRSLRF